MKKEYFNQRGTIRSFSKKKISDELLNDIILKATKAPTCGNMQLYSVIVTEDDDMKRRLSPLHFNQPAAKGADKILTICADFNRFTRWCEVNGATPGYNNFHSFIVALTDAVILAQQIVTIAEMNGLGTCYLGTVNYNASQISELLKLPELVVPVASIAIGYPNETAEPTDRLPLEGVLHHETYQNFDDNKIKEIHKEKEEYEPNVKFVKENNKKHLAEVFTDIRYPRDVNESVSKSFYELIKEKGFGIIE